MSPTRHPFVGRLDAAGFVIDPAHLGWEEAHRRVATAWVTGARLRLLDGRLLLILPMPVSVRAEQAPGLPVLAEGHAFRVPLGGETRVVQHEELPSYDPALLVALDGLVIEELHPVPSAPATGVVDRTAAAAPPAPDVRALAGVGSADTPSARRGARMRKELERSATPGARTGKGLFALLAMRSPAGRLLARRHQRYVEDLTSAFRGRSWDDALRSAIPLGGEGGRGAWTTRLPRRRDQITGPGQEYTAASGALALGPSVHEHLTGLYREAARQLENEGKHLLAAFVHADLLGNPVAAVELLERHGEARRAAELAEGWKLDPALVIRLWWRAGERGRAARIASLRGAFADAIARFDRIDAEGAVGLRRAWLQERRAAGDPMGAVLAAWPVEALRSEVLPDLAAGIAGGGRTGGTLLAHLLELAPTEEGAETARRVLDSPELSDARRAFVGALAARRVGDPALDRELASRSLVALTTGAVELAVAARHGVVDRLQPRADPLLVADLPRLPAVSADRGGLLELDARDGGQGLLYDAVAVGDTGVLVALGELGVRLVRPDGRVRGQWDVPTHRITVADHGHRALLLAPRESRLAVHLLDLPNRRPVSLPPLDAAPLDSYDGIRPVLASGRGLEWVELVDGRWRLVWRELAEPGQELVHVNRQASDLTAAFIERGELHFWHWALPAVALRHRATVEHAHQVVVLAPGQIGRLHHESGVAAIDWHGPWGTRMNRETVHPDGPVTLLAAGPSHALVEESEDAVTVTVYPAVNTGACATARFNPGARPQLRWASGLLTLSDRSGRVFVIDTERHVLVADLRADV